MKRTAKRDKRNKRDKRTRKNKRTRGGVAPVNYHLSGSWPSRMSLGQGADYFKYHEGQHGGALDYGAFPGAVLDKGLPDALRGPAHIGGIDKAIADVRGLCDPPNCPGTAPMAAPKVGGKRNKKNKTKRTKKDKRDKRNKKNKTKGGKRTKKNKRNVSKRNKKNKKTKGGSLGFAPFPSSGMLLDSQKAYAQAGLNPEWKTDIAFTDAKIRDTQ